MEVRGLLTRAVRAGSVPQSILLHGPRGVGKERLGLWLAQLIVCEAEGVEPCGECQPCRLVRRLEHPDVHWFFPLPRPDASSPEKLREKLEEARADELQRWRDDPLHLPTFEKAPAYFLAAIRNLQQLASMRPSIGRKKVFVVADAELMVPQESSPEAANAFLKLLEEPPPGTTVILTSSQPGALLPTIRSRVLSVRVGLVPTLEIVGLLEDTNRASGQQAYEIAKRARGSSRRAIDLTRPKSKKGSSADDSEVGKELLLAALSDGPVARLAAANDRKPAGARSDLVSQLESLSEWLRDLMAAAAGAEDHVNDPASLPILRRMVQERGVSPDGVMRSLDRVDVARDLALGNVNPQLIIATLLRELQQNLVSGSKGG